MRRSLPLMALALVVAACGDGEQRLSQAEFQEQGNAICAAAIAQAEELFAGLPQDRQPTAEEVEEFFPEFIQISRGQIDDIAALNPPEDIQDEVATFIDDARVALDQVEDAGAEGLLSTDEGTENDSLGAQAKELGLTECFQGP